MISNLLSSPFSLKILALIYTIIGVGVAFYFDVVNFMITIGVLMIVLQNATAIKTKYLIRPKPGESIFPYFGLFSIVLIIILSINYVISSLIMTLDRSFGLIVLSLILIFQSFDWLFSIENLHFKFIHVPINRDETEERGVYLFITIKTVIVPLILAGIYLFLFQIFNIQIAKKVEGDSTYFYGLIAVFAFFSLSVLINSLFLGQFYWLPESGKSKYKVEEFNGFPSPDNSRELYRMFKIIYKFKDPPVGMFEYLKENCLTLVKNSQDVSSFGYILYFIYAMNNWGQQVKKLVPYYNLITLSSFTNFVKFGYIPIYKRKVFYSYILSLIKIGVLPISLMEDIRFEINSSNFYAVKLLEPVFNPPELTQVNEYWTDIYEGQIFRGKKGFDALYNNLKVKKQIDESLNDDNRWIFDVWNVTTRFVKIFMGETSRKVFGKDTGIYSQILHLASKQNLDSFQTFRNKREKEIKKRKMQTSNFEELEMEIKEYTDAEKRDIIMRNLDLYNKKQKKRPLFNIKINYIEMGFWAIALFVNIGLYKLIVEYFSQNFGTIFILVEVIILALFGMGGYTEEGIDVKNSSVMIDVYEEASYNFNSNVKPILYLIVLLVSIGIISNI